MTSKLAREAYDKAIANGGWLHSRCRGVAAAEREGLLVRVVKHVRHSTGSPRRGLTRMESDYGWVEVEWKIKEHGNGQG